MIVYNEVQKLWNTKLNNFLKNHKIPLIFSKNPWNPSYIEKNNQLIADFHWYFKKFDIFKKDKKNIN